MRFVVSLAPRQHAAQRCACCSILTVILGVAYPLWRSPDRRRCPGLQDRAERLDHQPATGKVVGSKLIGQSFTDSDWQRRSCSTSRPGHPRRATGTTPPASSASNLGPESIVDTLPDPRRSKDRDEAAGKPACSPRSARAASRSASLEGVSGARPFCTPDGVGAVLGVFCVRVRATAARSPASSA